eukprot:2852668-Amphidinium_carterae.1
MKEPDKSSACTREDEIVRAAVFGHSSLKSERRSMDLSGSDVAPKAVSAGEVTCHQPHETSAVSDRCPSGAIDLSDVVDVTFYRAPITGVVPETGATQCQKMFRNLGARLLLVERRCVTLTAV